MHRTASGTRAHQSQPVGLYADPLVLDLSPQGGTPAYAAPEVLQCLQLQHEGTADAAHALINGPAADWWSVGVVLYELLTGERPFSDQHCSSIREAPDTVSSHDKAQWEQYECVLACRRTWVSTLLLCLLLLCNVCMASLCLVLNVSEP